MSSNSFQSLEEKVSDILAIFQGGLHHSRYFYKYIRISLTEQSSLRGLNEQELRRVYHYFSSIERSKNRTEKSVEEHAVPVKVLAEILRDEYEKNPQQFEKFIPLVLERCLWVVFITERENRKLNELGLKQKMPEGWDWKRDSPFIRYQLCGIALPEV